MTFHAVPDTAQVIMEYSQNGQICQNTYWVKGTGTWADAELDALVDAFEGWETTDASVLRGIGTTLTLIRATDYATEGSFQVERGESILGQADFPSLPNNASLSIKSNSGMSGRDKRGRIFWIGLTENWVDSTTNNQSVTGAYGGAVRASLMHLVDGTVVLPNGGELVIAHRRHGTAWIDPAITYPIVSWEHVDLYIDSQRRRLPQHNRHRR